MPKKTTSKLTKQEYVYVVYKYDSDNDELMDYVSIFTAKEAAKEEFNRLKQLVLDNDFAINGIDPDGCSNETRTKLWDIKSTANLFKVNVLDDLSSFIEVAIHKMKLIK